MKREDCIERLEVIINHCPDIYNYEIRETVWENYGKSRTYFKIIETKNTSKHYVTADYGYIDNVSGEYIPSKHHDLTKNYTISGSKF